MRFTMTNLRSDNGYSIIELSIVLIILSVILVPALHVYSLYNKQQKIDNTETALLETLNAVGEFRMLYGRYPCPASANAVPGDADYGYESRNTATGTCTEVADGVWRTASANAALSNPDVFIGSVPFRQMNLSEEFAHDAYGNRLGYAVTGLQTNDTTYSNANGGIGLVDKDDASLTDTPNSAHFVIISYNAQDAGAITRTGVRLPCAAATPEEENCDMDATFRAASKEDDFDDLLYYNTSDSVEQWQLSNTDKQDIHLRRSNSFAMGVTESTDTSSFAQAEIRELAADDGVMLVEQDPDTGTNGSVLLDEELCDESGLNCFYPNRIAGQLAEGEGMDCSPDFIVGIRDGAPVCDDEVFFSCPNGTFVSGFDSDGRVVCNVLPPARCEDETLTTTCGDDRTVTAFIDNGTWYGYGYSGQCYEIADLDNAAIDALPSLAAVQAYITNLNNTARTSVDCGPDSSTTLTRDTFECTGGSWNPTPVNTIERQSQSHNLANYPPLYNGGSFAAETYGPNYNPASPMSVDPNNTDYTHDCWCREDYRVETTSCQNGATGDRFRITRKNCPQTGTSRTTVYPNGGYDDDFCGCTPGQTTGTQSCAAYFGYSGSGITGTVVHTYNVSCPSGPTGTPQTTLDSTDTSNCACPANAPIETTTACPAGTTNNFTFEGNNYTGVERIYRRTWSCPGGTPPVQPITSAAGAGSYGSPQLVHTQSCGCDSTLTQNHHEACPAGYQGSGTTWRLQWNCETGEYDEPSDDNLISDDCHQCLWQAGSPRPGLSSTAAPVRVGTACPSCSGTNSCYDPQGNNSYKIWDGCYCAGQP